MHDVQRTVHSLVEVVGACLRESENRTNESKHE